MTRTIVVPLAGSIAILAAAFTVLPAVCTSHGTTGYVVVGVAAVLASLVSPFVGGPTPPRPGRLRAAVLGAAACAVVWVAGTFIVSGAMRCGPF